MHRTWFGIVGSEVMKSYVTEHQPLNLARTDGQAIVGFACFYVLMLAGTLPKQAASHLADSARLVGAEHHQHPSRAALLRDGPDCPGRFAARNGLVPAVEEVRRHLCDGTGRRSVVDGLEGLGPDCRRRVAIARPDRRRSPVPLVGYDWARFDPKQVPIELIEPLQEYAKTKQDDFPIFNDANLGGFLIYFTPRLKIFMDDRFELYGEAGLRDYIDMIHEHPERIEEWAEKAPFDRALVERHEKSEEQTAMEKYLADPKNGWREVARCKKAILYERNR